LNVSARGFIRLAHLVSVFRLRSLVDQSLGVSSAARIAAMKFIAQNAYDLTSGAKLLPRYSKQAGKMPLAARL